MVPLIYSLIFPLLIFSMSIFFKVSIYPVVEENFKTIYYCIFSFISSMQTMNKSWHVSSCTSKYLSNPSCYHPASLPPEPQFQTPLYQPAYLQRPSYLFPASTLRPLSCTFSWQEILAMEFSKQEYWSGLPFPSPGDLPDPGIKPLSPKLQADSLPAEPLQKPCTFTQQSNHAKIKSTSNCSPPKAFHCI